MTDECPMYVESAFAFTPAAIRYRPDCVEIEVADHGRGTPSDLGGGHGLIGMRERAAVFGGTLDAGPHPDGGFAVRATLPLPGAPT